jgi:hypothetical protein
MDAGDDTSSEIITERPKPRARRRRVKHWVNTMAITMAAGDMGHTWTWKQARARPDCDLFLQAAQEEIDALNRNGTWDLTPLPHGRRALTGKWVFSIKRDATGKIIRYKGRWVVRGFAQRAGIDYQEVFSTVVNRTTVKLTLAMAAYHDWDILQLDVTTAFLHPLIDAEIFVQQPVGFEDGTGRVCRLKKALYGLKQSPRLWEEHLKEKLAPHGFVPAHTDSSLLLSRDGGAMILAYVDDFLVTGPGATAARILLISLFPCKDLGPVSCYLGLQVSRDRDARSLTISQQPYLEQLRGKVQDCRPISTPLVATPIKDPANVQPELQEEYLRVLGCLMYATTMSRPDLAYAVGALSRSASCPTAANLADLHRTLRYALCTSELRLHYVLDDCAVELYADASWGDDLATGRSTGGFVALVGGAALSWASRLQSEVASSTPEAEYMALAVATREARAIRNLLEEMGLGSGLLPLRVLSDNATAIGHGTRTTTTKGSRHVRLAHHVVRDALDRNEIELVKVAGHDNVADAMTKPLPRPRFERLRGMLGLLTEEECCRRCGSEAASLGSWECC